MGWGAHLVDHIGIGTFDFINIENVNTNIVIAKT